MKQKRGVFFLSLCLLLAFSAEAEKPLMKDFIGINGHFQFKPELYKQTCRLVRNYHNMDWDVAAPGDPITFPRCVNGVDWDKHVYGKWAEEGFEIDVCAQFSGFGESNPEYVGLWNGRESWIYDYGYEMAKHFGPSQGSGRVNFDRDRQRARQRL